MQVSCLGRIVTINTPFPTQLINGVIHHEGLNADWPPSIEDCELECRSTVTQLILCLQQPPDDTGSQTKGILSWAIGGTN
tara:strand:+ start:269 stop:508 length:240 start_codon:yes stop_codon:yes gene_type:complete